MIGYRPHPSLLGGNGGSGGAGVDQSARDAAAAAAAVNASQETDIGALKDADVAIASRVGERETVDATQATTLVDHGTRIASGESKDADQDSVIGGHATRIAAGESKDADQDLVLTDHGTRIGTGETKDASQDQTLADHTTRIGAGETKDASQDAALADHGTRIGQGEAKDTTQDAALSDHGTRIGSTETKNASQDTLLGQHGAKLEANDTKDASQDTRLTNIENNLASGGVTKLAAVRIKNSVTGWDVAANAPARATHYEIVAIGGGASGVSTGTASAMADVYPKGGFPGAKRTSARRPINGETLDVVVGAGGASVNAAPSAQTNAYLQSAGSDTTVAVKKAGTLLARVAAAGGLLYSAALITNLRPESAAFLMSAPTPPIAGAARTGDMKNARACDAQNGIDMPTGGGGASSTASYAGVLGGKGGDVLYTAGLALHSQDRATGGIGGSYIDNSGSQFRPGAAGVNPTPDSPETYGPGGGGAGIGNDSGTTTGAAGGNGGFPGGGGGGAWKCPSGAGADGCVDVIYYGLAG